MPWICRSISERALKQAHLFSYCSQVAGDVPSRSRFKFFFHHCQALAKVKLEVDKLLKIKIEHDENITKQTMNCGEGGWNTIAKTFNKSRQFHYPCQSSFEMCEHLILVRYLIMNFFGYIGYRNRPRVDFSKVLDIVFRIIWETA